jgi:hypothetical protein
MDRPGSYEEIANQQNEKPSSDGNFQPNNIEFTANVKDLCRIDNPAFEIAIPSPWPAFP